MGSGTSASHGKREVIRVREFATERKEKAMQEEKAKNDVIYAPFLTTVKSDFGDVVAPHLDPSKIIKGDGIFARHWRKLEYGFKPGAHEAKWGQAPPIP